MSGRKPYMRSMDGWWRTDAYYVRYMAREVTAPFVALYAIVLLVGLVRLNQGEAAFDAWLQAMKSPLSLVLHLILLVIFLYHSWSWFNIMPKTMPIMFVGGKRVRPSVIVRIGLAAAVLACLSLFFAVRGMYS